MVFDGYDGLNHCPGKNVKEEKNEFKNEKMTKINQKHCQQFRCYFSFSVVY